MNKRSYNHNYKKDFYVVYVPKVEEEEVKSENPSDSNLQGQQKINKKQKQKTKTQGPKEENIHKQENKKEHNANKDQKQQADEKPMSKSQKEEANSDSMVRPEIKKNKNKEKMKGDYSVHQESNNKDGHEHELQENPQKKQKKNKSQNQNQKREENNDQKNHSKINYKNGFSNQNSNNNNNNLFSKNPNNGYQIKKQNNYNQGKSYKNQNYDGNQEEWERENDNPKFKEKFLYKSYENSYSKNSSYRNNSNNYVKNQNYQNYNNSKSNANNNKKKLTFDEYYQPNKKNNNNHHDNDYIEKETRKYYDDYDDYYYEKPKRKINKSASFKKHSDQHHSYEKRKKSHQEKDGIKYTQYLTEEAVEKGLAEKTLYEGIFISLEKNNHFALIKSEAFLAKVLLQDKVTQNRALNGSKVVFKILGKKGDRNETSSSHQKEKSKKENKKVKGEEKVKKTKEVKQEERKENDTKDQTEQSEIVEDQDHSSDYETISEFSDDETHLQELTKFGHELSPNIVTLNEEQFIAEIVFIRTNPYIGKEVVGTIQNISKIKRKHETYREKRNYLFAPIDAKLPWMFISRMDDKLFDMIEKEEIKLDRNYFSAKFLQWPINRKNPDCELLAVVGETGDLEIECLSLLKNNNVYIDDFAPECIEFLQKYTENWKIPEEERAKRLDLTKEVICTVDPATARDLDDALSIKKIGEGKYEIGVHIADVSHFVAEGDLVDIEARLRTTSVYLPHRVIPMLPRILCEHLCSLNPDVERLAFSIFFVLNEEGEHVKEAGVRITKSIMKSCGKLSYEVAQDIIEGKIKERADFPKEIILTDNDESINIMIENIKVMNRLAQKRRQFRLANGSLTFDKKKRRFQLGENNAVLGYTLEERKEANFMVEEYMLYANIFAGENLIQNCQEVAVLRKHEFPSDEKLKVFAELCKLIGIDNDLQKTKDINQFIKDVKESKDIIPALKEVINQKLIRTMQLARYFVVDQSNPPDWHHFALNFDIYTHFTSPIRRYPDILVHRLLFKVIELGDKTVDHTDKHSMVEIMAKCNECKLASRKVSEGCDKIFTCIYLKTHELRTKAVIISICQSYLTMIVFDLEIERKIYFKEYKSIKKSSLGGNRKNILSLELVKDRNSSKTQTLNYEVLNELDVLVTASENFPIDFVVYIAYKNEKGEANYLK